MTPRTRRHTAILAGIALATGAALSLAPGTDAQTSTFTETFTGAPSAPAPWPGTGWDVQKHSRDVGTWAAPEMMEAQHSGTCGSPTDSGTVTHHIMSWDETTFQCNDHLMTALKAEGYGVIYLTPPALADISIGTAVVSFDVSTLRTSSRDWIDVWLTPYADRMALPLGRWLPDLQGEPRNAIFVTMSGMTTFLAAQWADYQQTDIPTAGGDYLQNHLTPSAVTRSKFELRISKTRIQFGMPDVQTGGWWPVWDQALPTPLTVNELVVTLGHHSYNPEKDCGTTNIPGPDGLCRANTWHWDNVAVSPSVPVSINRLSPRLVQTETAFTFPPVPVNTTLQFAGLCVCEVSTNGGATWQPATKRQGSREAAGTPGWGGASSYAVPVPAGSTSIRLRGSIIPGLGDWYASDVHLWSFAAGAPPTATPTATATPSPIPSPTATPLPVYRCERQQGNKWVTVWQAATAGRMCP